MTVMGPVMSRALHFTVSVVVDGTSVCTRVTSRVRPRRGAFTEIMSVDLTQPRTTVCAAAASVTVGLTIPEYHKFFGTSSQITVMGPGSATQTVAAHWPSPTVTSGPSWPAGESCSLIVTMITRIRLVIPVVTQ